MQRNTLDNYTIFWQQTIELWRSLLKGEPYPICVFQETTLPAATLWTGARVWEHRFRDWNISSGSRVVIVVTHTAPFLQVFFGAWIAGLTIVPVADEISATKLVSFTDASCCIIPKEWDSSTEMHNLNNEVTFFSPTTACTPNVRLLLQTSGTSSARRIIALSDENIMSVIQSHQQTAPLFLEDVVLSVLPWFHCFGLVLELLRSLFAKAVIVRVPNGARNISDLLTIATTYQPTVMNMVPLTAERLFATDNGRILMQQYRDGIIGGAPVSASLAEKLTTTKLRVGYGQTEASPGIMLGEQSVWLEHYIGKPIGNEVILDSENQILFRGNNLALGEWSVAEKKVVIYNHEWHNTGDIAAGNDREGYVFKGRKDHIFKLSNGIAIHPLAAEAELRKILGNEYVYVGTTNGITLDICISDSDVSATEEQLRTTVANVIGVSKNIVNKILTLTPEQWKFTPKGENDRIAFQQYFAIENNI